MLSGEPSFTLLCSRFSVRVQFRGSRSGSGFMFVIAAAAEAAALRAHCTTVERTLQRART
jgi:hypothetical protein